MSATDEMVFVVDDDARVRISMSELLDALGWRAKTFADAAEYLAYARPDLPACLILDVRLPDINGLEFQRQLSADTHPPIVFITGYGDIPSSVRAMRHGAVDYLTKPVSEANLVRAVRAAIEQDRIGRSLRTEQADLTRRWAQLTTREREVLPLVVSGYLNKQVAAELDISEITVEIHRRKIMRKMRAASFAELVRMAARLMVPISPPRRLGSRGDTHREGPDERPVDGPSLESGDD